MNAWGGAMMRPAAAAVRRVVRYRGDKALVLAWRPGQAMPREADVVLLRGAKSFTARVDVA